VGESSVSDSVKQYVVVNWISCKLVLHYFLKLCVERGKIMGSTVKTEQQSIQKIG